MELILASRNAHKSREVSRMLSAYGLSVKPLPERVKLPPEIGDSFEANALPKARIAARELGVAVLADDSGIESQALAGRPGVRSARFAGEDATDEQNLEKLLAEAPAGSALRYVCVVAYVDPETETERLFSAECRGTLAQHPAGENGFGYDPVFLPSELTDGRTMAQLGAAEKDELSHRGRAVRAFAEWYVAERR